MQARFAALVFAALLLCGCSTWSTWPPIEHTAEITRPTAPPVPTLIVRSVAHVNRAYGGERAAYTINLPEGIDYEVYDLVISRLGEHVSPMMEPDTAGYHVTQVRSRATTAEVDVIFHRADGLPQLVTVELAQRFLEGWKVEDDRAWRITVDLPATNYVAPIEPEDVQPVDPAPETDAG